MNKSDLFRKVTNCIHLKNKDTISKIDEIYIVPEPKKEGAFFFIIKQKGKYICIGNWLHSCRIVSRFADASVKFDCTLVSSISRRLAIYIEDDWAIICTDWDFPYAD